MPVSNAFSPGRTLAILAQLGTLLLSSGVDTAVAQERLRTPVVDSIAIESHNVFSEREADKNFVFRLMNRLRIPTRRQVVEREVLLESGRQYDSLLAAETERNLRALRLFREVAVDTLRLDGRLVARIRTQDAWSTKPIFRLSINSDGTWTGRFGVREVNLFGTGNLAYLAYRKEEDRDGFDVGVGLRRVFGTQLDLAGTYIGLSDGDLGGWWLGDPWRSFQDKRYVSYQGEAASQRVIRYRVESGTSTDTTFFRRRAFVNRAIGAIATTADPREYVRIGVVGEIRQEEYILEAVLPGFVPDTVKGFVGVFGEARRAHFRKFRYLNAFADEDVDLSPTVSIEFHLAPEAFGYHRTGIGTRLALGAGGAVGSGFVQGRLSAGGLFNSAGLDSGRVVLQATLAQKPGPRHATLLHFQTGLLANPPPGGEFDIGFGRPPRSWEPHSFVGTRLLWTTLEHRWFVFDRLLDIASVGLAAFVDYGGAWYEDQNPRWGGNVGVGLRTSSALSSSLNTSRVDFGYRFGSDVVGTRWVLSLGTGFPFP